MKNVEIRIGEGLTIIYDIDKVHLGRVEGYKELKEQIRDQFVRHELLRIIFSIMPNEFALIEGKEGDENILTKEDRLDYVMLEKYLNILLNNVRTIKQIADDVALGNLETDFKHLYIDLAKKIDKLCERFNIDISSQSNVEESLKRHTNLL